MSMQKETGIPTSDIFTLYYRDTQGYPNNKSQEDKIMEGTKIKKAKEFTREFRFAKEDEGTLRTVIVTGEMSNAEMCSMVKAMLNDGWSFNFDDLAD